jgi:hypothetical protein
MNGFVIRPFTESDISQTAELHRREFELPQWPGQQEAYRTYLNSTFLNNKSYSADCPSLVAVDDEARVIGFLGVVMRPMIADGAPIRAAVSSQFIVDRKFRTQLAGIALLKQYLSGPQDLSFTDEANEASATIWERLGGARSPIHSSYWILPLRPAGLCMWRMRLHGRRLLPACGQPFANAGDEALRFLRGWLRRDETAALQERHQHPGCLIDHMKELRKEWRLMPDYNSQQLEAMIAIAGSRKDLGEFRLVSLRRNDGRLAGWYMYYANSRGPSEVIQMAARSGSEGAVLSHLVERGLEDKTVALTGRMDPRFQQALTRHFCALSPRQYLMLVHSRDLRLIHWITTGSAFLSRLEGEWCVRFC